MGIGIGHPRQGRDKMRRMGQQPNVSQTPQKRTAKTLLILSVAVVLLLLTLACGSFAPRPGELPTRTPTPVTSATTAATRTFTPVPTSPKTTLSTSSPTRQSASPTDMPEPTATPTPPGDVVLGQQARILAPSGVNIRQEPSTQAGRGGYYPAGALVVVLDGPAEADGYIWWEVDDEHGKRGWVAGVTQEGDLWLSSDLGEARPVNRPVRLGDTVYVSVASNRSLTVRYEPGSKGFVARRVVGGTLLSTFEGPVVLDGLRWWKVLREDGLTGWAAEGDNETRWLKPME